MHALDPIAPPAPITMTSNRSIICLHAVPLTCSALRTGRGRVETAALDHVPPPTACIAAPNESDVDHLGFRVPIGVVSPWARPGYVSHNVHSHTSILRFIEALNDLPALTARDANSDAMMEFFDFSCPSTPTVPATVPMAGQGGC